jgi:hypothetical protein
MFLDGIIHGDTFKRTFEINFLVAQLDLCSAPAFSA